MQKSTLIPSRHNSRRASPPTLSWKIAGKCGGRGVARFKLRLRPSQQGLRRVREPGLLNLTRRGVTERQAFLLPTPTQQKTLIHHRNTTFATMSGTAADLQQAKQARAAHARAVRVANKEKREKLKAARVARMARARAAKKA
ncbi:hypothetical protein CCUS01_13555 [Colletotrichum cuscutae]|uniref:Uncharacterized protein n=1 Tax=Colletotrichum cuscutae TaxID=1209917 RepID=A0AAI9YBL0_9PEZI|nr:hypothetical protein CCUS01_13555 [Colletotrichum cuscutae]